MAVVTDLTENQIKVMRALRACGRTRGYLIEIAHKMKYRPARSGILAVSSTLRSILRKGEMSRGNYYGCASKYVGYLYAKDQWSSQCWFLTDEGEDHLTRDSQTS